MNAQSAGIYRIVVRRPRGEKFYIGQAMNLSGRWKHHLRFLNAGKHKNIKLQRAFDKYGESALSFEPLLICDSVKPTLTMYEQRVLDSYPASLVYNISRKCVESRLGVKTSRTTREKMSAAALGRVFSPETRKRISLSKKGWRPSSEHIQHLRALARSDENRSRMSMLAKGACRVAKIGKKKSPEEIARRQATRAANQAKAN